MKIDNKITKSDIKIVNSFLVFMSDPLGTQPEGTWSEWIEKFKRYQKVIHGKYNVYFGFPSLGNVEYEKMLVGIKNLKSDLEKKMKIQEILK